MQFERFYCLSDSVLGVFTFTLSRDFSQLSQIWGYVCGGNGMNVLPYAHPQLFKVFKYLIYDVGCSLKGSTASVIV
jgi:hypothetical protein